MKSVFKILGVMALILACVSVFTFTSCSKNESGKISITGSTTVLPIAQKCSEAYMKTKNQNVSITVSGGGSSVGIAALIDGRTDIADASREIKDKEITKAKENGITPVATVVAKDGLAIIVNKNVSLKEIDVATIKKMYMGEIKNWSELGVGDGEIVLVSRDTSSGTYETFEKKVMNKEKIDASALMVASNKAALSTVVSTPNSIAYVGLGYLSDTVNVLTVEGVNPSNKTVNDGSYKISRSLYMYTNGEPKGAIKKFLDFVTSSEGQKLVEEVGYVPLS
ncbi:MAG: phosphate ABC transporter substrate-binding protein [Spirochaetes bacterium]|nr:phosphate ABC transporter substrate-binding protein [Spirochaetota bacterium]